MLTLSDITIRLGTRAVIDGASAALPARSRVGLVGRNGSGKSTLLKAIAGINEIDGGAIEMPRGTRVGYIAQEAPVSARQLEEKLASVRGGGLIPQVLGRVVLLPLAVEGAAPNFVLELPTFLDQPLPEVVEALLLQLGGFHRFAPS